MENEQPINSLETLLERTSSYVETRVELAELKATKKSSEVDSSLVSKMILGGILFMGLMVLNIAAGLWLGEILGKSYHGFFVLTLLYTFIAIILYISREKWLKSSVANVIIKKLNE